MDTVKVEKYLKEGQKLDVRLDGEDGKYYKSQVLAVQDKFFLIIPPYRGRDNLFLHRGDRVEVVLYGTNEKCGFTAAVIKRVKEPFEGFMLEAPEEGKRIQMREFVRVKVLLDVEWAFSEEKDVFYQGIMVDLSGGGAGIVTDVPVDDDVELLVRFHLPIRGREVEMLVKSQVRRCQPMAEQGKYLIGAAFQGLSERDRDQIIEYVFQKQREQRILDLDSGV